MMPSEPDFHDAFEPHADALARGELDRGAIADLLADQILTAIMLGADDGARIGVPIEVARQLLKWAREAPKGKGSGRGKRKTPPQEAHRRRAVVEWARKRRDELKAERAQRPAQRAAEEAERMAVERLGIRDLSASTIRDRMRR